MLQKTTNESLENTTEVTRKVESFDSLITETLVRNKNSLKDISATNDEIFMSLAKLDHVIWKVNTYISVIEGKPTFKFVDHLNCRLGKWYNEGDGKINFSHLSNYNSIEIFHAKVHEGTKEMFEYLDDIEARIDDIIHGANEMEEASTKVFEGLDNILKEKKSL